MKRTISRWGVVGMAVAVLSLIAGSALANNVVVTNTELQVGVPGGGKAWVEFDLSWDNSWRDGVNHDACWVFVKYSTDAGSTWSHATLGASGTNPADFASGSGTDLDIVVPADKLGVFIQRTGPGAGTVANTGVKLVWDFTTDGVSENLSARVKVFAIEMVYVPTGSFYLGSGGSGTGEFYEYPTATAPYAVTSEDAIAVGESAGNLDYTSGGNRGDGNGPIPAAFPKGYAAFYLMKTEVSQRQYCDFLNTLTAAQQATREGPASHFNNNRDYIKKTSDSPAFYGCDAGNNAGGSTSATAANLNEANDGEWVACGWFTLADGWAYADWAAMRPMTELEFEKACRGPLPPVADEYAWGDALLETPNTTSLTGGNTDSETPASGNCNHSPCSPNGPFRCGSYARATSTTRANAGAGYYGALDLSGNLLERTVPVGTGPARGFTGSVGDGELNASGNANAGWPTSPGYRGGSFYYTSGAARVSDRTDAAYVWTGPSYHFGFRAAR